MKCLREHLLSRVARVSTSCERFLIALLLRGFLRPLSKWMIVFHKQIKGFRY
jgi:hypothetical protein